MSAHAPQKIDGRIKFIIRSFFVFFCFYTRNCAALFSPGLNKTDRNAERTCSRRPHLAAPDCSRHAHLASRAHGHLGNGLSSNAIRHRAPWEFPRSNITPLAFVTRFRRPKCLIFSSVHTALATHLESSGRQKLSNVNDSFQPRRIPIFRDRNDKISMQSIATSRCAVSVSFHPPSRRSFNGPQDKV